MDTDVSTQLLETLTAVSGAPPSMSELLAQLGESDPRMALVAKYLNQRESAQAETTDERQEKRESLARLERILKRLYRELEELRERNDSLAAALGACYLCWGEDAQCEICVGVGAAGWNAPDEILFQHYVTPAIRWLQTRTKPAQRRPRHPNFQTRHSKNDNGRRKV
jgi:hypothetical protein